MMPRMQKARVGTTSLPAAALAALLWTPVGVSLPACSDKGGSNETAAAEGSLVMAVIPAADVNPSRVGRFDVLLKVPDGLGTDEEVILSPSGYRGAMVAVAAEARDADGDGKVDVVLAFQSNPFTGPEISFRLAGNIRRPFSVVGRAYEGQALYAEGTSTKDTKGRDILFEPGDTSRVIEVRLACRLASGCSVPDAGTSDAGTSD
jgi:hypothetical protein